MESFLTRLIIRNMGIPYKLQQNLQSDIVKVKGVRELVVDPDS